MPVCRVCQKPSTVLLNAAGVPVCLACAAGLDRTARIAAAEVMQPEVAE